MFVQRWWKPTGLWQNQLFRVERDWERSWTSVRSNLVIVIGMRLSSSSQSSSSSSSSSTQSSSSYEESGGGRNYHRNSPLAAGLVLTLTTCNKDFDNHCSNLHGDHLISLPIDNDNCSNQVRIMKLSLLRKGIAWWWLWWWWWWRCWWWGWWCWWWWWWWGWWWWWWVLTWSPGVDAGGRSRRGSVGVKTHRGCCGRAVGIWESQDCSFYYSPRWQWWWRRCFILWWYWPTFGGAAPPHWGSGQELRQTWR